jgi:hypothetical protein
VPSRHQARGRFSLPGRLLDLDSRRTDAR